MSLSEAEREEFLRLRNDTYDPELWSQEDFPALRAARAEYERKLREESDSTEQDAAPTVDEETLDGE